MKIELKPTRETDAEFYYEIMQDPLFQKYYLERLLFKSKEEAKKEISKSKKGQQYYFTIYLGKEKIGLVEVFKINGKDKKASIGYALSRKYWGKGYATQACKKILQFIKTKLRIHAIEATADPKNTASKRVLEKNGFELIGTIKDYYFDKGKFKDRDLYWKIL